MEIISIHKPYLYSAKFDEEESDEFNRLFDEWTDISAVYKFLNENKPAFDIYFLNYFNNTLEAAEQVANEADEMESYFEELKENTEKGQKPDYDSYFKYLDGIYRCEIKYIPMKGYGEGYKPSLIRFYAIKIEPNVYVIATGGIKLCKKIQDSPGLNKNVFNKINKVRKYLSDNGIINAEDID